jgi:hypothetical protein
METASLKMKPATTSAKAARRYSLYTKGGEKHGGNTPDIYAFTLDFKFALDQFRVRLFPSSIRLSGKCAATVLHQPN